MRKKSKKRSGQSLTSGLLLSNLEESYQIPVWRGVRKEAAAQDVNLICFVGGLLDTLGSKFYDMVSSKSVDGLMIVTASIGIYAGSQAMHEFCGRYQEKRTGGRLCVY